MTSHSVTSEHDEIAREISSLWEELHREIEVLGKAQRGDSEVAMRFTDPVGLNDIERRLLVRSIFSCIEALAYSLKRLALSSNDAFRLSLGERMLAAEESYDLSRSGTVATRRAKLPTLTNLRFAFELLAKVEDHKFRLDVSHRGWQLLQHSLKVRDRLMHPKKLSDLQVSDEEIRSAVRAFTWFESQLILVLLTTIATLRRRAAEPGNH